MDCRVKPGNDGGKTAIGMDRQMCLACEEQEYFFRIWCLDFLARGEMPPGVTAEDLEALGLPPPKPLTVGSEPQPAKNTAPATSAFVCDSPDE
jgi:hypothetical protein